ncbi:MAG TPA: VWA domain-containing protein [Gemmatimonadota bacterium]|nr:VWA domain-containing protein [Gemmatimonadota bacterium]
MSILPPIDPFHAGIVAAVAVVLLRGLALYRAAADRSAIGDPELLARMAPPSGIFAQILGMLLVAGGTGLLAAAFAAGGFGGDVSFDDATGYETVVVLDASNSMLAEDVRPSRLRLEQALARRIVGRLAGRIGVVYFAGSGYVLSPLTEDRAATLMFTEAVHPTHVGQGGTSMVDGLEQALVVLAGGRSGAIRSIVLFSDGESTVDETALDVVLERARRGGVTIYAVGVGTGEGGRIPMPPENGAETDPSGEPTWLRDRQGRIVVSRLDEGSLREIARATGGLYAAGPRAADALLERMPAGGMRSPVSSAAVSGLLLAAFLFLAADAYLVRRA